MTNIFQDIANETQRLILTFIAPENIVRLWPSSFAETFIRLDDLYELERVIGVIKSQWSLPKGLDLIIHTPWGLVFAATKIFKFLRKNFEHIRAFIPYEASSWWTLIALCADEIVMDAMSSLTPIDAQLPYPNYYWRISASTYKQVIDRFEERFWKYKDSEIPAPYSHLMNRLDPIIFHEMEKMKDDGIAVAKEALTYHVKDKEKAENIAKKLVDNKWIHAHVIGIDEANEIWLNVSTSEKFIGYLNSFRGMVRVFMNDGQDRVGHKIYYLVPQMSPVETSGQVAEPPEVVASDNGTEDV